MEKGNNNWALEISGEKIRTVSWKIIQDGLISLRVTDDDSYLTLKKNPDTPDSQILQTALPSASSGRPPVYSVQTAEGYGKTLKLYEIEMERLDDVIAFFKAYYEGEELDLSKFSHMPL